MPGEQVAADIATDSIRTIVKVLTVLRPASSGHNSPDERLKAETLSMLILSISILLFIKNKLLGKIEQGSQFLLTPMRVYWINCLYQKIDTIKLYS